MEKSMNIKKGFKYHIKNNKEWYEHTAIVCRCSSHNSSQKRDDDEFQVYDVSDDRRLLWNMKRKDIEKYGVEVE